MRSIVCLLLLGIISGCQSSHRWQQTCVPLAATANYCLAPLPWQQHVTPLPADIAQQVRFEHNGKAQELLLQLQFAPENEIMVGLAPLGQSLFTLSFDGNTLNSEHSVLLASNFRGDYLMAVQQLVYWPAAMVQQAIPEANIRDFRCQQGYCRELTLNGKMLASIHYEQTPGWQSPVAVELPDANLRLTIKPM
ncbi:DUF3261 domain-containing protein [Shewanella yunxiaonensis]|uniref:DUF3261 domain-containing protein n=1 Tax=Shewanella yunxiaonensis TaxID=2829809 RepID=A0ABX7YTR5_9GAMM|nr:DUF3261 domain-containing protein [Shewanella yunxiaonensis]QUN05719.1 DUF3261 domain-containing protein [Shewanella yunxiaonensis]